MPGGGYLDCLKYAHENGCPWDSRILSWMVDEDDMGECTAYAIANGCPGLPF
jgi:hypothetical protein